MPNRPAPALRGGDRVELARVQVTPARASWRNLVECWFSIVERQAIHRGSSRSVRELTGAIRAFIDGWNDRARPLTWTRTAEQVLRKAAHPSPRRGADAGALADLRPSG